MLFRNLTRGLCLVAVLSPAGNPAAAIIDPCLSSWQLNISGAAALFVCPAGDTDAFVDQGVTMEIEVRDQSNSPIANIPGSDLWLIDCDPLNDLFLCGGSSSTNADFRTDAQGQTRIAHGTMRAGGCVTGLALVVQGFVIEEPGSCSSWECKTIKITSPDIVVSLVVDLSDLAMFADHYPPNAYDPCCDFDQNGVINVVDLSLFAAHWSHTCF